LLHREIEKRENSSYLWAVASPGIAGWRLGGVGRCDGHPGLEAQHAHGQREGGHDHLPGVRGAEAAVHLEHPGHHAAPAGGQQQ